MIELLVIAAGLAGAFIVVAGAVAWWVRRSWSDEEKALAKRIGKLSFKRKLRLGLRVLGERRAGWALRVLAAILVLYLAMPFDIIPDFIPVVGYLDDLVILVLGTALLLKSIRREVLEEHVQTLEAESTASSGEEDETEQSKESV